jgi:transporter family-2 protein
VRVLYVVPLLVGAATVVQGGLNRLVADKWGLAPTVLWNNAWILVLSLAFWIIVRSAPGSFPDLFVGKGAWADIRWWWMVPAFGGVIIVAGIPWAIARLGALPVLVGIVASQMVVGLLWDALVEGQPITALRVVGATLAVAGVFVAGWR